eukprot:TRINITY_DN3780_c0_g1_i4.p1 TRINITY_DN3780_c0_g1~~TRINITY_DN3780_c0_g1_i4.p1  ORF type:complete len:312 (-),score=53.28 TRINITY_DN3780_c0_g1_i4:54-989(-)
MQMPINLSFKSIIQMLWQRRRRQKGFLRKINFWLKNYSNCLPSMLKSNMINNKQHKKLKNLVRKFHVFQPKKKDIIDLQKKQYRIQMLTDEIDTSNQELMNQRIHILITLIDISFINFLPVNWEEEKYFLEIKSSTKAPRKTNPEMYLNFSKSVINEYLTLSQIYWNRLLYIALFQKKDGINKFLGDFELDLQPYYKESQAQHIHQDLRNWKELYLLPNYMPKDMRKKGWVDFNLSIKSQIKAYQDSLIRVDEKDEFIEVNKDCLLYTSDAADDMQCVDLGGRRIIKKKKKKKNLQSSSSKKKNKKMHQNE